MTASKTIIGLIITLLLINGCGENTSKRVYPRVEQGILDLSGWDFEKSGIVKLSGEWKFYWNEFINPEASINNQAHEQTTYLFVPNTWNEYKHKGERVGGHGFVTYRLKVILKDPTLSYSLKLNSIATAYKVWINGRELASIGRISQMKEGAQAKYCSKIVEFQIDRREIDLIIQVSNFHHRKGGIWEGIELGTRKQIMAKKHRRISIDFFLFGSLVIMGVYHLGLFFLRPKEKSTLYFGLICLLWSVHILLVGERLFSEFFPIEDHSLILKLEFLSLYISIPLFPLFFYTLFPDEFHSLVVRLSVVYYSIINVITVIGPSTFFTLFAGPSNVITIVLGVYGLFTLLLAVRRNRDGAVWLLVGMVVLMLFAVNDALHTHNFIITGHYRFVGLFVMTVTQSFTLAIRLTESFRKHEILSVELDKTVKSLSQANAQKDEFVANMSHELRTPMHHILSYSQIGRKRLNSSSNRIQVCFDRITLAGNRMMHLIDDLLDLSTLESGRLDFQITRTDLSQILSDLTTEFLPTIKEKSIHFEIKETKLSTIVLCDELKIYQVLRNIISNALKFTPAGKSVIIEFETKHQSEGRGRTAKKTVPALITKIKDEGVGIPNNELETVFDKFIQSSRTKTGAGGTGLGLSICKEIIEQHHGRIWAENNTDGGATFSFILPYDQEII